MKLTRRNSNILILIGDLVFIPLSFVLGHYLRFGNFQELSVKVPAVSLVLITIGYIFIFYLFNLYELKKDYLSFFSLAGWVGGVLAGAMLVSFLNYGLFLDPIGRGIFIFANVSILILAFGLRLLFHHLLKYLFRPKRLLICGAGEGGAEMARVLAHHTADFELIGYLGGHSEDEEVSRLLLGDLQALEKVCYENNIDVIVTALHFEETAKIGATLMALRLGGVEIVDMPDLYQELEKRIPIDYISQVWFLKARGLRWSESSAMIKIKRVMDVTTSLLILILTLPLSFLIVLAIKLTSRGPVFYVQERIGRNNKQFRLYKFRSMIHRAEEQGAVWAEKNDARVTPVGRILRRLHLDELPQLFNVLKGEMSLVGARPERPVFVEEFNAKIPYYSLRHFMRPGLTGWAQVTYPYASSLKASREKLEYDLYYVYHAHLIFDLRIILKTFKNFFRRG